MLVVVAPCKQRQRNRAVENRHVHDLVHPVLGTYHGWEERTAAVDGDNDAAGGYRSDYWPVAEMSLNSLQAPLK